MTTSHATNQTSDNHHVTTAPQNDQPTKWTRKKLRQEGAYEEARTKASELTRDGLLGNSPTLDSYRDYLRMNPQVCIPLWPEITFKGRGWAGVRDYLGLRQAPTVAQTLTMRCGAISVTPKATAASPHPAVTSSSSDSSASGNATEAVEYLRRLAAEHDVKTALDWSEIHDAGLFPPGTPRNLSYAVRALTGSGALWGVLPRHQFIPIADASLLAKTAGVTNPRQYRALAGSAIGKGLLPTNPDVHYGKKGQWVSWRHFLQI